MKVYARYSKGSFYFSGLGLTELDVLLTNCENSACMQTETGKIVAGKLVSHTQRLSSAELADGISDSSQLMLAVDQSMKPANQLSGADSGNAPKSVEPVPGQPGPNVSGQLGQSAVSVAVEKPVQYAQVSRKIREKFSHISGFCRAASNLIMCIRPNAHQTLLMLRVWWSVLQQSQEMYPPKAAAFDKVPGCVGYSQLDVNPPAGDLPQVAYRHFACCKPR